MLRIECSGLGVKWDTPSYALQINRFTINYNLIFINKKTIHILLRISENTGEWGSLFFSTGTNALPTSGLDLSYVV